MRTYRSMRLRASSAFFGRRTIASAPSNFADNGVATLTIGRGVSARAALIRSCQSASHVAIEDNDVEIAVALDRTGARPISVAVISIGTDASFAASRQISRSCACVGHNDHAQREKIAAHCTPSRARLESPDALIVHKQSQCADQFFNDWGQQPKLLRKRCALQVERTSKNARISPWAGSFKAPSHITLWPRTMCRPASR